MTCVVCRAKARPIRMPIVGNVLYLCDRCRGAAFIREMRKLVAHG